MNDKCKKTLIYIGCAARILFILGYYFLITWALRLEFENPYAYWPVELFVSYFFLYSTARTATFGDRALCARIGESELGSSTHRRLIVFLFGDAETRIELIAMAVVLFAFPIDFGICSIGVLLRGVPYYLVRRLLVLLCSLPLVLLAYYFGRRSAIDHMASLTPREACEGKGFLRQILLYIALGFFYILSARTLLAMLGVAATLLALFVLVAGWLGAAVLAVFLLKNTRVLRARRRLCKRLRRICRQKKYRLRGPHRLYRSFFFPSEGPHFSVEIGKEIYDCRVYSTRGYMKHISVDDDGYVTATPFVAMTAFALRRALMQSFMLPYSVRTPYSFESKYRKILIITPAVHRWFIKDEHGTRNADIGTNAFGYKLYNAETFLGLLDRDALGDDYMRK